MKTLQCQGMLILVTWRHVSMIIVALQQFSINKSCVLLQFINNSSINHFFTEINSSQYSESFIYINLVFEIFKNLNQFLSVIDVLFVHIIKFKILILNADHVAIVHQFQKHCLSRTR